MKDVIDACRAAMTRGVTLVLTGAGVSAESGIPTFRGKEGYWTIGARDYQPQELATYDAFGQMPWEVWAWYLYRRGVCRAAEPNAAHHAIVRLERARGEAFALITQNVDGLHRRAGSADARMHAIHGEIDQMRCADDCTLDRYAVPDDVPALAKGAPVPDATRARLVCPRCGAMARPHVLWFDEEYDEPRYHLHTVQRLADQAGLLITAGTSAQTELPCEVVAAAVRKGATIIDINIEDNPFGELATHVVRTPAARAFPELVDAMLEAAK
jgi:NAD-dependent deacetylase